MKTFQQFMEQPEIINMMKGFAQQNKKSPKELRSMRDGIINTVGKKLGGKLDLKGIMKKIPSSQEMQNNMKKAQTGLVKKLKSDVMNMFIGKGEELLNKGSAKLKDIKNKMK